MNSITHKHILYYITYNNGFLGHLCSIKLCSVHCAHSTQHQKLHSKPQHQKLLHTKYPQHQKLHPNAIPLLPKLHLNPSQTKCPLMKSHQHQHQHPLPLPTGAVMAIQGTSLVAAMEIPEVSRVAGAVTTVVILVVAWWYPLDVYTVPYGGIELPAINEPLYCIPIEELVRTRRWLWWEQ